MKQMVAVLFLMITACVSKNEIVQVANAVPPAVSEKALVGKFSYSIGTLKKSIDLKSLSVSINKETVDDGNGNTKSNSSLDFTIHDFESKLSFRFHIKDENVVFEFDGEYSLRNQGGFNDGEPIRSTSIMIVNTDDSSKSYFSMAGGTCTIKLLRDTLAIEIKNASVKQVEQVVPFSFSLKMDGVKVRNKLGQ